MPFRIKFHQRIFEWWLACGTFGFGAFLAWDAPSMDSEAYSQLIMWMSEGSWATFFVVTGLVHITALAINGRRWWTPIARVSATSFNYYAYALFGWGFYRIDNASTAVYLYSIMVGSAALICCLRAIGDMRAELKKRNDSRKGAPI